MGEDEKFKNSAWLLQYIHKRIDENRNFIAIFTGDTGSGKSYSAMRLAERVDPNFSVDRIVFTVTDFIHLINSDLPKGSVVIFDDAGLGINARLWQEQSNKLFGMVIQGFRYKQINVFFTVPKLFFIDRQSRNLAHMRFQSTKKQGLMKAYLIIESKRNPDNPLEAYHKERISGKDIQFPKVRFHIPSPELREQYEVKKKNYMDAKFRQYEEELSQVDIDKGLNPRKKIDREKIIVNLHEEGLSMGQISKVLGTSKTSVHRTITKKK